MSMEISATLNRRTNQNSANRINTIMSVFFFFLTFRYGGKVSHIWKVQRLYIHQLKNVSCENPTSKREECSTPQLIQVETEKGELKKKIIGTPNTKDERSMPQTVG